MNSKKTIFGERSSIGEECQSFNEYTKRRFIPGIPGVSYAGVLPSLLRANSLS